jgi:ABC-type transport system involved in cytochrome c biogenesis ATPase subunit
MRIEQFRIQGFKSIADLTVEGLSDINVFFGMNDVGKSNIFQALELWRWLLTYGTNVVSKGTQPITYNIPLEELEAQFGSHIPRLGQRQDFSMQVALSHTSSNTVLIKQRQQLVVDVNLNLSANNASCSVEYKVVQKDAAIKQQISLKQLDTAVPAFQVIHAARRLQLEQRSSNSQPESISDKNLKQALFYAYLSSNLEQKRRLSAIRNVLAESPFNLGQLDIALDPKTDRIDIGFVRADGRLPIENLGSGAQQLILVLGQIFLNDYPIIAVEEPEMNLSPQYQEHLMATLRKLMQDPAVKLQQLFISTHSPYLEFTDNFYDVTFDPDHGTQVKRATSEDYAGHFDITPTGPDTGARLNSLNQVKLYEGVIHDLNLQRGDLVIFVKNEVGGWELRSGSQLAKELQTVTNGNNAP